MASNSQLNFVDLKDNRIFYRDYDISTAVGLPSKQETFLRKTCDTIYMLASSKCPKGLDCRHCQTHL
jgi:hypothetical protein